jgi:hypothetical protein
MPQQDRSVVGALADRKIAWYARRKLAYAKSLGQTGVLLSGVIRTPSRGITSKQSIVSVRVDDTVLCSCSPQSKFPKFAVLGAGPHRLTFDAIRSRSTSSFERYISLNPGDVLVAICEPIQSWTIFGASPDADRWWLGVM